MFKGMRLAAVAVAAVAVMMPVAASAQDSGLAIGLRGAFAAPMGAASDSADLKDLTKATFPVQLDVEYRFNPKWRVGVNFAYGPAMVADDAKDALEADGVKDVTGHAQMYVGGSVTRAFLADRPFSPWVSLSGGYEWTRYAAGELASGKETEIGVAGWVGGISIGGDYNVTKRFAIGPYVGFDLGQYRQYVECIDNEDLDGVDIDDKGIHQWLKAGVKATFKF